MWFAAFVLLTFLLITKGGEVYDVTTIYDVGSADFEGGKAASVNGSIHARTNALGLPVCVGEDNCIVTKDSQLYNITCDTHKGHCSWDTKDWTWTPTSVLQDIEETKVYKLTVNPTIAFKNLPDNSDVNYLYFTSGASSIKKEKLFFVLRFWRETSEAPQLFAECRADNQYAYNQFDVKDRDGTSVRVGCASFYSQISFNYHTEEYLSFEIANNNIKIYKGLSPKSVVNNWSPLQDYKDIQYFSMSGNNFGRFRPSVPMKALSATREGSDMISPIFSPDSSQLCLVLVVHSSQDTSDDILHILAMDNNHGEHHLEAINNVKAGWNIKHANITLQTNISSLIKLVIRKVGSLPIDITRISSCSPLDEEGGPLSPFSTSAFYFKRNVLEVGYNPDLPVYTVWSKVLGKPISKDIKGHFHSSGCDNGGMVISSGCACPPGFTGQRCQFGCGRNRFGQDCGGLCSFRLRECQGLLLCTNHTGCRCAPGYQGINCNQECLPGWYGNDCSQLCGHCASGGPCDVYTGECSSCESGYHPPHCKQAHVFYTSKPELSTPDYGKITVSFNPVKYVSPGGKPKIYQIQFREKDHPWDIYLNNMLPENQNSEEKSDISETIEGVKPGVLYQVRVLLMDVNFNKYDGDLVQVSEIRTKYENCVYYTSSPELSTPDYGQIAVSFNPFDYFSAIGKPQSYQIQYREKDGPWLMNGSRIMPETQNSDKISETIEGLKAGVLYQVRVLLIYAKSNTYDGELVQVSEILTKCYIPEEYDYKLKAVSDSASTSLSWTYADDTENWCPVISYEVSWKEGWKWSSESSKGNFSLSGFLPGLNIKFRVRAKTSGGFAPFSKTILYNTPYKGTSAVWDLKVVSNTGSSVSLAWEPPRDSDGRQLQYTVTYKCVKQLACTPGCLNATEGHLTVGETSATLNNLLPFAQYQATVSSTDGPKVSIFAGTTKAAPTEIPVESAQKPVRTNTSLTVFWDHTPVCSSFFLGYNYILFEGESLKVLANGFTKDTTASFHNLTASTMYIVGVSVQTVNGLKPKALLIKTSTSARVPDAVRNLTVYYAGSDMLAVRWAAPLATYGPLKSFTVKHELDSEESSHTVEPTTCVVWPDLYCHTIKGLKTGLKYNVTVSARNVDDGSEDGVGASVIGSTVDSPPSAPDLFQLVNFSSTSLELQWRYPSLANGVLRSFVVSVEETEKHDQGSCCHVTSHEILFKEEAQTYTAEVSGLQLASKLSVKVSAKTVKDLVGPPSEPLVVYTRPPHLGHVPLPRMVSANIHDRTCWRASSQLPEVNNTDVYKPLTKTHLLLAELNGVFLRTKADSGISDRQLNSLLKTMISNPFFFLSEYTEDEEMSLFSKKNDSSWGQRASPLPFVEKQKYNLVAVRVTKYHEIFNADLRYSNPFRIYL